MASPAGFVTDPFLAGLIEIAAALFAQAGKKFCILIVFQI
jgi:hypothetical protein